MDPLLALMQTGQLDDNRLRRLAAQMREGMAGGAQLAVSDLDSIAEQGRLMQNQGQTMARDIGLQQARALAEQTDRQRIAALGQDSRFSKLSTSGAQKIEDDARQVNQVLAALDAYKPEYQSALPGRPLANAVNALAATTGLEVGTTKEASAYWAALKNLWELGTRNELFGSALTSQELAEWNRAAPSPGDTVEQTQAKMDVLRKITINKARQAYRSGLSRDIPQEFLDINLGDAIRGQSTIDLDMGGEADLGEYSTEELLEMLRNGQ